MNYSSGSFQNVRTLIERLCWIKVLIHDALNIFTAVADVQI